MPRHCRLPPLSGLALGLAVLAAALPQGAVAQGVSCFAHFTASQYSWCKVVSNTSNLNVALHWNIDAANNSITFGVVHAGGAPGPRNQPLHDAACAHTPCPRVQAGAETCGQLIRLYCVGKMHRLGLHRAPPALQSVAEDHFRTRSAAAPLTHQKLVHAHRHHASCQQL